MPATEHLYRELDNVRNDVSFIYKAAQALARSIEALVSDFTHRHGGDFEATTDSINGALSDLTDDAVRDKLSKIEELERQIADIEQADLRRSAPVVL